MITREEKIELLKRLQSGEITPAQLPKPQPEPYLWHFDGIAYIRLVKDPFRPHPSGISLTASEFGDLAGKNLSVWHTVYDSTGMIDVGNIQPEVLVPDDFKGEITQEMATKANIWRIGVQLPLEWAVPIKASQLQMYGLL